MAPSGTHHPALRWAVPGAVVAIVLGAVAVTKVAVDAAPTLTPRTAAELLVDVQNASVTALSGTVVQKASLGLPDLPVQMGDRGSSSFTSLVSGTHTLRVWYAGATQQRIALLGTLGESDLIRNGTDVWTWSSETNTATHYQLPARPAATLPVDPSEAALTPQQAADAALAAIDPTTEVTTESTDRVADRAVYELVLTPKDTASLIGQVRIAIDAEQHVPLRVQVMAQDVATPAFEVGFTQVSFDPPSADQFQFVPPPGATVTESTLLRDSNGSAGPKPTNPASHASEPKIIGTGWTSVLVAPAPANSSEDSPAGRGGFNLAAIAGTLPEVSGEWGTGRLLQSSLFSLLITDDGRVLVGAVAPDVLYQAAAQ